MRSPTSTGIYESPNRRISGWSGALLGGQALVVLGLVALGCAPAPEADQESRSEPIIEQALGRARTAADALGQELMTALGEQLERGTPAAAVTVCSEIAPAKARELSRDGVEIRRTSVRYRNSVNAPDPWERAGLERLEELLAAGELPPELYDTERRDDRAGVLRYLRPIVVGPQCLQCHGSTDELDSEVRQELARVYPADKATGFAAGDLRGAFSVIVETTTGDSG